MSGASLAAPARIRSVRASASSAPMVRHSPSRPWAATAICRAASSIAATSTAVVSICSTPIPSRVARPRTCRRLAARSCRSIVSSGSRRSRRRSRAVSTCPGRTVATRAAAAASKTSRCSSASPSAWTAAMRADASPQPPLRNTVQVRGSRSRRVIASSSRALTARLEQCSTHDWWVRNACAAGASRSIPAPGRSSSSTTIASKPSSITCIRIAAAVLYAAAASP